MKTGDDECYCRRHKRVKAELEELLKRHNCEMESELEPDARSLVESVFVRYNNGTRCDSPYCRQEISLARRGRFP